jgi:hypothetical protein
MEGGGWRGRVVEEDRRWDLPPLAQTQGSQLDPQKPFEHSRLSHKTGVFLKKNRKFNVWQKPGI